jgi:F0F1-type ATP synthase membrane subunit a
MNGLFANLNFYLTIALVITFFILLNNFQIVTVKSYDKDLYKAPFAELCIIVAILLFLRTIY